MGVKLKPVAEQVIVITGASSGIGLATSQMAAARGARVVMVSRDAADLARAASEIRANGGDVVTATADVADRDALERAAETALQHYGRIDTWVNNAGVSIYGRIEEVDVNDARRLFETNYWGMVYGSLVALAHVKRTGGALINVGSVLSETGYPLQGHYAASKHAVKGFTDSLRLELREEGAPVSLTLIQPAAIDTPYTVHAKNYMDVEPQHMGPVYAPEIVASAILECAAHPHRNLRVGGAAKLFTMTEKVAPGLADRQKMAGFQAQRGDAPARDDDTLHTFRSGDARLRGNYPGRVRKTSMYTAVAKRPVTAGLVGLLAVGVGAVAANYLMDD